MKFRTSAQGEKPGVAIGLVGTTVVHGALVAAILVASAVSASPRPLPPAYAVELVAAPRPDPQIRRAPPEALPTPPAEKPAPIKPPPKAKPVPKPPEPKVPPRPEPETKEPPAVSRGRLRKRPEWRRLYPLAGMLLTTGLSHRKRPHGPMAWRVLLMVRNECPKSDTPSMAKVFSTSNCRR